MKDTVIEKISERVNFEPKKRTKLMKQSLEKLEELLKEKPKDGKAIRAFQKLVEKKDKLKREVEEQKVNKRWKKLLKLIDKEIKVLVEEATEKKNKLENAFEKLAESKSEEGKNSQRERVRKGLARSINSKQKLISLLKVNLKSSQKLFHAFFFL